MVKAIKIDRERLNEALSKRNLIKSIVSNSLGMSPNYLSSALNAGVMRESVAIMLEKLYGIPREEYEYFPAETAPVEKNSEAALTIDYVRLQNVIYQAAYLAVVAGMEDWERRRTQNGNTLQSDR